MVWPFGASGAGKDQNDEPPPPRRRVSWPDTIATPTEGYELIMDWAPVVLFSAASLGVLQLYANYLRRIPGAAHVRPSLFRNGSIFGKVTRVGDGDNFHMFHTPGGRATGWGWLREVPSKSKDLRDRTISVRIAGIDAPEGAHFGRPAQPFAAEALKWLSDYILHRNVRIYVYKRDHYERIVASVYVRRFLFKKNVGLEMVKRGLATMYEAKQGAEYGGMKELYERAEATAKRKRRGMWSGKPSEFESPREYKTRWAGYERRDNS